MKLNPDELYAAVVKHCEQQAFEEEQKEQPRELSKNERIAFRRGFYRGMRCMPTRAPDDMWDRAAKDLERMMEAYHEIRR